MVVGSIVLATAITSASHSQQLVPVPQARPQLGTPADNQSVVKKQDEPARIYQSACPALLSGKIKAKLLPPVLDGQCGERSPLELSAISLATDITFPANPQINCRIATAMVDWAQKLNNEAQQAFGSPVASIQTGPGYQCRRRNNLPEGKISEHGFANALDITSFKLANGREINIERDWPQDADQPAPTFLRTVHKQACEIFTTVLGPDANAYHRNHFHVDLGCHGKACGYLICE